MKDFLKKFLSDDEISALEQKYIAATPGAKSLPTYISKQRLDEVIGKQKTAEASVADLTAQIETLKGANSAAIEKAVKEATDALNAEHTKVLEAQKKDFDITEAIYKAKGRNVKAIKALIDPTKDVGDEIARLQKEESYLFVNKKDNVPGGTGKQGDDDGGDDNSDTAAMRKAVGI